MPNVPVKHYDGRMHSLRMVQTLVVCLRYAYTNIYKKTYPHPRKVLYFVTAVEQKSRFEQECNKQCMASEEQA